MNMYLLFFFFYNFLTEFDRLVIKASAVFGIKEYLRLECGAMLTYKQKVFTTSGFWYPSAGSSHSCDISFSTALCSHNEADGLHFSAAAGAGPHPSHLASLEPPWPHFTDSVGRDARWCTKSSVISGVAVRERKLTDRSPRCFCCYHKGAFINQWTHTHLHTKPSTPEIEIILGFSPKAFEKYCYKHNKMLRFF